MDAHRTGSDACDQWGVARINTELARLAWQRHKSGFAGEDGLFRTDDIYVDGTHRISQIFLAFSIASSMVPTMVGTIDEAIEKAKKI